MAALTKNFARCSKNIKLRRMKAQADVAIYHGAMLVVDANGYVIPAVAGADNLFAGISTDYVDTNGMAAGECEVEVESMDAFEVATSDAVTQADLESLVHVVDDNTVSITVTATVAGKIVEVLGANKVMVKPLLDANKGA